MLGVKVFWKDKLDVVDSCERTMMFIHAQLFGPGKGASAGAIAGGVVAGVIALVLGVLVFLFYRRRKAKQGALLPSSEESSRLGNHMFFTDLSMSLTLQQRVTGVTSFVEKHWHVLILILQVNWCLFFFISTMFC